MCVFSPFSLIPFRCSDGCFQLIVSYFRFSISFLHCSFFKSLYVYHPLLSVFSLIVKFIDIFTVFTITHTTSLSSSWSLPRVLPSSLLPAQSFPHHHHVSIDEDVSIHSSHCQSSVSSCPSSILTILIFLSILRILFPPHSHHPLT